jgi:hypothetical protein
MSGLIDKGRDMNSLTKLTIIPDTRYSSEELGQKFDLYQKDAYFFNHAYMHGKLEEIVGFDLFSTLEPNEDLEDGIYDADFDGRCCKLFLWTSFERRRGLVVLCVDTKSMEYAQECYDRKASTL